ncbi:MAG TPA: hypothetical protein VH142_22015 [Polyangiaceae bacterium]|nr:hypothetical protein [Polyangiaceae bacterium]
MNRQIGWLAVLVGLVSAGAVGGCGSSNDGTSGDNGTGGAPGSGGDGITPVGGSGGGVVSVVGSGGASAGGAVGSGGATTAAPVPCGSKMCTAPAPLFAGFPSATACCVDATAGTCGTASPLMNGACAAPPAPDTRCPSSMTMFGTYTGCCTNNDCGLDVSSFGLGCVDTSSSMASMFLGSVTPTHCDGTPFPMNTGGTTGGTGGRGGGTGGRAGGTGGRGTQDGGPGGSGPGDASTSRD